MWTKLNEVGSEMISVSRSLSEISKGCFRAQLVAKMEQAETYGVNKRCACQCCGEKEDGGDCLACDSCEEIYHFSCVEPTVKDSPRLAQ
ncbi:hypothetical protein KY284_020923 [Solanum tuberosum]|nr:hypothetical protein KY284_020923 [Solanum tuberosum]